jgi:hypothetical protein
MKKIGKFHIKDHLDLHIYCDIALKLFVEFILLLFKSLITPLRNSFIFYDPYFILIKFNGTCRAQQDAFIL